MTALSEHFSLSEFTATRQPIDNDPPSWVIERLRWLCVFVMEPIRAHWNRPIVVTSGFRSPGVNTRIGGAETSFHLCEEDRAACDFQIPGVPLQDVLDWIVRQSDIPFDKAIIERGKDNTTEIDDCIHIQICSTPRRIAMSGSTHGQGPYKKLG